jgi:hypothetical protein
MPARSTAAVPPATYEEAFSYSAFESNAAQQLAFVGSARIHDAARVALLTPAQNDQVGALWRSGTHLCCRRANGRQAHSSLISPLLW